MREWSLAAHPSKTTTPPKNDTRKQATYVPHSSPLPNRNILLTGSFASGTSYVRPLSSALSDIFLLF